MTVVPAVAGPAFWWTPRRARWLLLAVHVGPTLAPPLFTLGGLGSGSRSTPWVVLPLAAAIAAIQLSHAFAAADNERPPTWPLSMMALIGLVYVPMVQLRWNWASYQSFVVASLAMHGRARVRVLAMIAVPVGTAAAGFHWEYRTGPDPSWPAAFSTLQWLVALTVSPAILYGAARLVRTLDELYATRAELAEQAMSEEWLRTSRDLHDVLGQSLTAVSLKGDLALALLPTDGPAAAKEIRSLTEIAQSAQRDAMMVTRGEHVVVSFVAEANRAAELLEAAGIEAQLNISVVDLAPDVDAVLAWVVREGVANVLRHSRASVCSIAAGPGEPGHVRLELVNDGASRVAPHGSGRGLTGVAERAGELGGSAFSSHVGGDQFLLWVEVPEERS